MKIKLVVYSFPTTTTTFLFNLVVGLEQQGHTVTVCAQTLENDVEIYKDRLSLWSKNIEIIPYYRNMETTSLLLTGIVTWIRCILQKPKLLFSALNKYGLRKGARTFLQTFYLSKGQPDIIHFAFSDVGIYFMNAISLLDEGKSKLFVSCRGTAEKLSPIVQQGRISQLNAMFDVVSRVHCVSKDMMAGLLPMGLSEKKAFVNYPSVDLSKFQHSISSSSYKSDRWNIVTTGRLAFQKGYVFSLQAMRCLKDRGYNFTYNICGEGPDRPMLLYMIHELKLQNEVILHGRVSFSKIREQLNKADIFVLPSLWEGISNAALEAMAMEIPVVTTRAGGMVELVVNKENGMLVDRFDESALANAIEELLRDSDLRKKVARNARKTIVDNFTLEQQIEVFINEYQTAIIS